MNLNSNVEVSEKSKAWMKKHPILTGVISFFIFGILISSLGKSSDTNTAAEIKDSLSTPESAVINENIKTTPVPTENKTTPVAKKEIPSVNQETKASTTQQPAPDRSTILAILKTKASEKWGTDYEMVKYEYDKQVVAYDWVIAQTAYPNIMASAKKKWGYDYEMVKYEYEKQVDAFESL